jgi:hypothetical protein
MHLRRSLAWLALPYARRELPGWQRVLTRFGVCGDGAAEIWRDAEPRRLQGKWHGFTMRLDLRNGSERLAWFLGRHGDLASQRVLLALLRPGDDAIDVGARIGMLTLLASHAVGPSGRVAAFEPDAGRVMRLRETLCQNRILNVRVHALALSDRERRGDDVVRADPKRLVAVAIDTGGQEVRVVRGLLDTLAEARPAVLSRTDEVRLRRAGFRLRELARLFQWLGYAGYAPRCARARGDSALRLEPLGDALPRTAETLWLHPESEAHSRVARLIPR